MNSPLLQGGTRRRPGRGRRVAITVLALCVAVAGAVYLTVVDDDGGDVPVASAGGPAVPPVIAETSSGASSARPTRIVRSETSARSRSGSARWRRRTASSPVSR